MTLISSEISEKDGHIALLKSINNQSISSQTEDLAKLYLEKKHLIEKLEKENGRKFDALAENDRLINELDKNYEDEDNESELKEQPQINNEQVKIWTKIFKKIKN